MAPGRQVIGCQALALSVALASTNHKIDTPLKSLWREAINESVDGADKSVVSRGMILAAMVLQENQEPVNFFRSEIANIFCRSMASSEGPKTALGDILK